MKLKTILICIGLASLCISAAGQDLKPVKDRDSKLFGYQDKSKNWVIPPSYSAAKRFNGGFAIVEVQGQKGLINESGAWVLKPEYDNIEKFDKAGLCEVMRKEGKTKYRGVANTSGELVMPVEFLAINISRNEGLIMAERSVEIPRAGYKPMWGVYDVDGNEVFAPQFASSPSFHNGRGIAKSAGNGLMGVIDRDGEILLPFDYLAVSSIGNSFEVLSSDFVSCTYDAHMFKSGEYAYPGYVAPYDPAGDPVRAAAWHVGPIGARLHRNNLKLVSLGQDSRSRNALCNDLRLDWSYDRFVRFEPFPDEEGRPGSMLDPESNTYYTVKAILYEKDGHFVQEVSRWGWLEAECNDGFLYNAEGAELWIALKDINTLAVPSFTLPLSGYKQLDHSDIYGGLGVRSYDVGRMYDPSGAIRRYDEIREGENVGITSYLPRPAPELKMVRALDNAMRSPLFRHPYRMGQVLNCKVHASETSVDLDMSDRLVLPFADEFRNPHFTMKGDEEIFWGPNNARTVRLSLECVEGRGDTAGIKDDVLGTNRTFCIVLSLHEEDGSYLRTLAVAPCIDFASDDVLVFEKLGIALLGRGHAKTKKISLKDTRRIPAVLSEVNKL